MNNQNGEMFDMGHFQQQSSAALSMKPIQTELNSNIQEHSEQWDEREQKVPHPKLRFYTSRIMLCNEMLSRINNTPKTHKGFKVFKPLEFVVTKNLDL